MITGVEVSEQTVLEASLDTVVLATGAKQILPDIPGVNRPYVYLAESVREGKADLCEKVVIIGRGAVGCETALFLINHGVIKVEEVMNLLGSGRSGTIVEMLDRTGAGSGPSYRWVMTQNLRQKNVAMMNKTKCLEIGRER